MCTRVCGLAAAEVINVDVLECPEQHYSDVRLLKTLAAAAVSICCAVSARADFRAKRIGPPLRACLLGVLVILPLAMLNIAAKRVWCAVRVPVTQQSRQSKEFPRGPLHRLLSRRRPLRQSREQILRPLLKLRARRRLSKTGEPSDSSRGRRRSTLTRR